MIWALLLLVWTVVSCRWTWDARLALAQVASTALGVAVYAAAAHGYRRTHVALVALCVLASLHGMARNGNLASEFLVAWCVYLGGWPGLLAGCTALPGGCLRAVLCLRMSLRRWQVPTLLVALTAAALSPVVLTRGQWDQKVAGRLEIWKAGAMAWREFPLTGHGAGAQHAAVWLYLSSSDRYAGIWQDGRQPMHLESDPLEAAVTTGLVGVALWGGLLWSCRAWRRPGACAVLAMGLLGFPLAVPATAAVFWTDLGDAEWHERYQGTLPSRR